MSTEQAPSVDIAQLPLEQLQSVRTQMQEVSNTNNRDEHLEY